jgi:flavin-dependent dehydrogenase
MWNVIVAGAGPAGLVVSTLLARGGREVLLLDPHGSGHHKVGESVPGAIARLMRHLNLPPLHHATSPHRDIGGIVTRWAGELRSEDHLMKPEGGGWRLDRGAFERELAATAVSCGVQRQEARVRRLVRRERGWQVETDCGRELATGFLVDATGRPAALARHLGTRRVHGPPLVAVWGLGEKKEGEPTDRTYIESTPEGWWYGAYLPDGRPLAVFHTAPALASELRHHPARWRERLAHTHLLARLFAADAFDATELSVHDARSGHLDVACGPGWTACGDSALSFDPLSSQGIFNALACADMAATAILAGGTGPALETYQNRLREIRIHYARRRERLYQSAAAHFGTPFWHGQLALPAIP